MENNISRAEVPQEAPSAVSELSGKRKEYAEWQQRFRDSERNLDALKKKIETEKETAIRTRRTELELEYEKLLRAADAKIADAEKRRKNARTGAMNDRVKEKTAEPRAKNAQYRAEIRKLLKENRISGFCGTGLFMVLFNPSCFTDVLKMALAFLIMLVGVPFAVTLFIKATWLKILVFAVIDVIFIVLYFVIYGKTVAKKPGVFGRCREIRKKIRAGRKEIHGITRTIEKDPDDSCYNLNAFDAELTKLNQEKNDIVMKKQEAQAVFENTVIPQIRAEIDGKSAEEMEKARKEFSESSEATKTLADVIARLLEEEKEKTMEGTDPEGPGPETKG